jgi:hypothetical protein
LRLLLNEIYPAALADALRGAGMDVSTAVDLGLAGRSDSEVFALAVGQGYAVLTENAADFARISADHLNAGDHHPGLLVALSSRFSRRPAGAGALVSAVSAIVHEDLRDRVVYLQQFRSRA